jgi:hypothetical protein
VNEVLMGAADSTDPLGVGPLQHWFVLGGTTTPFHFEFVLRVCMAPQETPMGMFHKSSRLG